MFDKQEKEEAQHKAEQIKENVKSSTNGNDDAVSVKQEASVFSDIVNVKVTTHSGRQANLYTDGQNIEAHGDAELGNKAVSAAQGGEKIGHIQESGAPSSPILDQAHQLLDTSILSDKEKAELLNKTNPAQFKNQEEYIAEIKQKMKTKENEARNERQSSENPDSKEKDGKKEKDPGVEAMKDAFAKVTGHRGITSTTGSKDKKQPPVKTVARAINRTTQKAYQKFKSLVK